MSSIVIFPEILGARYYLGKSVTKETGRVEYQLFHDRESAHVFDDREARELARRMNGQVRPSTWTEDETKKCSICKAVKSVFDFHGVGNVRYPNLRRSMCKKCDHQVRADYRRAHRSDVE